MKRIEALGTRRRSPRDDYVDSLPADESIKEFKRVCRDLHHSNQRRHRSGSVEGIKLELEFAAKTAEIVSDDKDDMRRFKDLSDSEKIVFLDTQLAVALSTRLRLRRFSENFRAIAMRRRTATARSARR